LRNVLGAERASLRWNSLAPDDRIALESVAEAPAGDAPPPDETLAVDWPVVPQADATSKVTRTVEAREAVSLFMQRRITRRGPTLSRPRVCVFGRETQCGAGGRAARVMRVQVSALN